jgi:hypothetical protein
MPVAYQELSFGYEKETGRRERREGMDLGFVFPC